MVRVLDQLEKKIKDAKGEKLVQVDTSLLESCLKNIQEISKQYEQLQEQQRITPSVARKLNDTIRRLEYELEVNQNANKVKDLERKVMKLELDLKQSYSTRNFTLKQGLLDLEKRYRTHIYGHPDMQELWSEVMWLMVEDKDREKAQTEANTAAIATKKLQLKQQVAQSVASSVGPDTSQVASPGAVQKTVDQIQSAHGTTEPLSLHYPTHVPPALSNVTVKHQRSASGTSMYSNWSHMAAEEASQKAPLEISAAMSALRSIFGSGRPVFPDQDKGQEQAAGVVGAGKTDAHAIGAPLGAQAELNSLQLDIEKLLDLWKQRSAQSPADMEVGQQGKPSTGESKEASVANAAYLEQQAEAALRSLALLREKYGATQTSEPNALDKQADQLSAAIHQLRALCAATPPAAGVTTTSLVGGKGLTISSLQARGSMGPMTPCSHASEDLRRFLLGPASPGPNVVSHKDMITHFVEFLSSKGMLQNGAVKADSGMLSPRSSRPLSSAGTSPVGAAGQTAVAADGKSAPALDTLVQQFGAHLQEAGMSQAAAAVLTSSEGHTTDDALRPVLLVGNGESVAHLPLLPALRLSTAASKAIPGTSTRELLSGTALNDVAPSWWAASLEAASKGGNVAIEPNSPTVHAAARGRLGHTLDGAFATATAIAGEANQQAAAPPRAATTTVAAAAPSESSTPAKTSASTPDASTTVNSSGAAAEGTSAAGVSEPAVPFDPLLLPGPARTMQAVMAHVRARHAAFLARCPEAEQLLTEALAASAELQVAQDKSLLRMAVMRTSARPSRPTTPRTRLSPVHSESQAPATGDAGSKRSGDGGGGGEQPATTTLTSYGSISATAAEEAFEFPGVQHTPSANQLGSSPTIKSSQSLQSPTQQQQLGSPPSAPDIQPAVQITTSMDDVSSAPMTMDDYHAELVELRHIASRHAEHAAALQELLVRLATQHAAATEAADDLEMRVALGERENMLLKEELETVTKVLVDTKMAFAEKDMESTRLVNRLKKSLTAERLAKDEVEELRRHLAVMGQENVDVVNADDIAYNKAAAAAVVDVDAVIRGAEDAQRREAAEALAQGRAALAELRAAAGDGTLGSSGSLPLPRDNSVAAPVLPEHEAHLNHSTTANLTTNASSLRSPGGAIKSPSKLRSFQITDE